MQLIFVAIFKRRSRTKQIRLQSLYTEKHWSQLVEQQSQLYNEARIAYMRNVKETLLQMRLSMDSL